MRGLLIETFAGCRILEDSYADEHRYRVVTVHDKCLLETGSLLEAYVCARQFAELYQCTTE